MGTAGDARFVPRRELLVALFWATVTVAGVVAIGPASDALSEWIDLPGRERTAVNAAITKRYGLGGFAAPRVGVVTLPAGTIVADRAA